MEWANEDSRALGADLMQWHSSGGDPIYAVGSYLYAGHEPKLETCFEALRNMLQNMHDADTDESRAHAWEVTNFLVTYIEYRTGGE